MSNAAREIRLQHNIVRLVDELTAVVESNAESKSPLRAAVVGWDLAHNPVGRALVLYRLLQERFQVDLVGPLWDRFGTSLWEPIAAESLSVKAFSAWTASDFVPRAVAAAGRDDYDVVVCSKNRLPGIFLATLIAEWSDAPLIVDLDDDEMAFADPVAQGAAPGEITDPLDINATGLAMRATSSAEALTVVSDPLLERWGGTMVRHARPSGVPVDTPEALRRRADTRARYGIRDDEHALFFVGTVRPHKGVQEIVAALEELPDVDARLHVFTNTPPAHVEKLVSDRIGEASGRFLLHGPCRMDEIEDLMLAADLVVLAQAQDSPIGEVQVPAKISDATAVGCPVLVPDAPVFDDLAGLGLVTTYQPGGLVEAIKAACGARSAIAARRLQQRFAGELSETVNSARLASAVDEAQQLYEAANDGQKRDCSELHEGVVEFYNRVRSEETTQPSWSIGASSSPSYDFVFFWKQNDSGLYGRRSDMIVKHIMSQGRARRVLHFDSPTTPAEMADRLPPPNHRVHSEADHIFANILDRHLRTADHDRLRRRTFLYRPDDGVERRLFGSPLPTLDEYPDYVLAELAEARMEPHRTVAWVWPVAQGFSLLSEAIDFGAVVCDLVDDQRQWPGQGEARLEFLRSEYEAAIDAADIVFTNSPANADAFVEFGKPSVVVPNAAERVDGVVADRSVLDHSALVDGPLLGYVGNMRDRVDWDLLEAVALHNPNWNIVLAGEVAQDSPAFALDHRLANLHLLGVVPYDTGRRLMAAFDVGLIPHAISDQSMRMDPLKLYNFAALGIPIVSTAHPSAMAFAQGVLVANEPDEFCAAIEFALREERGANQIDASEFSWDTRVDTMFALIDGLKAPRPLSAP